MGRLPLRSSALWVWEKGYRQLRVGNGAWQSVQPIVGLRIRIPKRWLRCAAKVRTTLTTSRFAAGHSKAFGYEVKFTGRSFVPQMAMARVKRVLRASGDMNS